MMINEDEEAHFTLITSLNSLFRYSLEDCNEKVMVCPRCLYYNNKDQGDCWMENHDCSLFKIIIFP